MARIRRAGGGGGSPPRAWGQHIDLHCIRVTCRFTPTGVGTTRPRPASLFPSQVHPHGRGDNAHAQAFLVRLVGSPPRAWGQQDVGRHRIESVRFTPTGVGTTRRTRRVAATDPVHPHGRGDNEVLCTPKAFIPVHPHGRGDNAGRHPVRQFDVGSPPRAWGQPPKSPVLRTPNRFTPTGVGTTLLQYAHWRCITVHPHGRGDNRS